MIAHPIVMPDGRVPCDICDACISKDEADRNRRIWDRGLCDGCAGDAAATNPDVVARATAAPAKVGNVELRAGEVTVDGSPLQLTGFELRILQRLLQAPPSAVVSHVAMGDALYAEREAPAASNVIQVIVSRLRILLRDAGARVRIDNVRLQGYRLVPLDGGSQ